MRWMLVLIYAGLAPALVSAQTPGPWIGAPSFAGGQIAADAHALNLQAANQESLGVAIARLDATTTVQAALMKHPTGGQTNGLWNLGLLRFNSTTGVRETWPDTSAFQWGNNQYRVWPNQPDASVLRIKRVVVAQNHIFVLLDWRASDRQETRIVVFSTQGLLSNVYEPLGDFAGTERWAGDMQVYSTGTAGPGGGTQLVVVGAVVTPASGARTPLFRRYQIEASGDLVDRTGVVVMTNNWCDQGARCQPERLAFGSRGFLSTPAIYVVGRVFHGANFVEQGLSIGKLDANGLPDPAWNSANLFLLFDARTIGPGAVLPMGIAVRTTGFGLVGSPYVDQVTVAANVQRNCGWGVRVWRSDNSTNMNGTGVLFGGSDATGIACSIASSAASFFPRSMVRDDQRLIIAGRRDPGGLVIAGQPVFDAFIAQIDTASMTVQRQDTLTWPLVGPRQGNSEINDVLLDGSALIGTGVLQYPGAFASNPALAGKAQSGRLRLEAPSIFSDGFEQAGW
jgi:hypothetical protein